MVEPCGRIAAVETSVATASFLLFIYFHLFTFLFTGLVLFDIHDEKVGVIYTKMSPKVDEI